MADPDAESRRLEACLVEVGDTIYWSGRWVRVTGVDVEPLKRGTQKTGRRFDVFAPDLGPVAGLHWSDKERVLVLDDPNDTWTDGTF